MTEEFGSYGLRLVCAFEDIGLAEEVHQSEGIAVRGTLFVAFFAGAAAVEGEEDGISWFEGLLDVGTYGFDVARACSNISPDSISGRMQKLTFMTSNHRKRLAFIRIRQSEIRMTDPTRHHLNQNLAIVQLARDFDISHLPVRSSFVFGPRLRGNNGLAREHGGVLASVKSRLKRSSRA